MHYKARVRGPALVPNWEEKHVTHKGFSLIVIETIAFSLIFSTGFGTYLNGGTTPDFPAYCDSQSPSSRPLCSPETKE